MKLRYLWVLAGILPLASQAAIYKSVDADGHVTYSSEPMRGSKRIVLESAGETSPSQPPASPRSRVSETPHDFPRVDSVTQRGRDDTRRRILEDELAAEARLLGEAKKALQEGESNPEVFRGKDGKIYRNVAKYDEKIKGLQEQVELHQKNIEAIQTELSKIR